MLRGHAPAHASATATRTGSSPRPRASDLQSRVNPTRDRAEDPAGQVFTAAEFAALTHPPCPTCGHLVHLKAGYRPAPDRAPEEIDPPAWVITGWTCPTGCSHQPLHALAAAPAVSVLPGTSRTCRPFPS